jgi:hypothetical protein
MRLLLISLIVLALLLAGCGQVFVGFVSNPGNAKRVRGTVSMVQLGFIDDGHGTSVMFTAVTFVDAGTSVTINFCGDQKNGFPLNRTVQADFATGALCSTLIAVVVFQG